LYFKHKKDAIRKVTAQPTMRPGTQHLRLRIINNRGPNHGD
jgi:hypothetical protein